MEHIAAEDPRMENEKLTQCKVFLANADYINMLETQARWFLGSSFGPSVQMFCGTTKTLEAKGK